MTETAGRVIRAGGAYFAITFAVAFALGVVRQLVVAPRLGGLGAVALEVPILVLVSAFVAGRLVTRFAVPRDLGPRAAMGGLAFVLLQSAEAALALVLQMPFIDWLADLFTAKGALGLAAQIVFALLPIFVRNKDTAP